ncbi:Crp/Fnr family transcriptional regulator [Sunxiuqinia indica]|uniref:Crp/Fnr family transcriptional regulator n=1 Tax=Sunxiuqinia indica TaxID=2692584 RepID=UPI001356D924|nr:Crp/Fnr family transcriptional regulator [Sunxiuqinia indica]
MIENYSIEDFKDFLKTYITLPENDWNQIKAEFEPQVLKKNEMLLEEGSVCRYFYFFNEGLFRFCCNIDGEDITKTFCKAPYCFTSKISFRNQTPASEGIQALEKCVVWRITYEQYKRLEQIASWNTFMRKLMNEIQEFLENHLLESKILTAEQYYDKLLERFPADFMQKIPLKHLASFLGVAPQSMSRIRNKLHKKSKKLT